MTDTSRGGSREPNARSEYGKRYRAGLEEWDTRQDRVVPEKLQKRYALPASAKIDRVIAINWLERYPRWVEFSTDPIRLIQIDRLTHWEAKEKLRRWGAKARTELALLPNSPEAAHYYPHAPVPILCDQVKMKLRIQALTYWGKPFIAWPVQAVIYALTERSSRVDLRWLHRRLCERIGATESGVKIPLSSTLPVAYGLVSASAWRGAPRTHVDRYWR